MRTIVSAVALIALAGCSSDAVEAYRSLRPAPEPAHHEPVKVAATSATGAAGDPNKMICKSVSKIGSNFPQRVCSTATEWQVANEKAKEQSDAINDARNRADTSGVGRANAQ